MIKPAININNLCVSLLAFCVFLLLLFPYFTYGIELTSTNFKILDPVISIGGGRSTSQSFQVEQSIGQPVIGLPTSASFQLKAGFLSFSAPAAAAEEAVSAAPPTAVGGGRPLLPVVFPIISPFLPPLPAEIPAKCGEGFMAGDINCDRRVDLRDLSIFFFLSAVEAPNPADFNKDGALNTKDLSILLSNWTERFLAFVPDAQFVAFEKKFEDIEERGQFASVGRAFAPSFGAPSSGELSQVAGLFEKAERFLTKIFEALKEAFRTLNHLFFR